MPEGPLVRVIERAISAAVQEALRRVVVPTAVDGSLDVIDGATGEVDMGEVDTIPCTIAYPNPAVGDRVVVVFFGKGIAYAFGPIAGPAA